MASSAILPLLTVADFLQIDFGPDMKAELDNGVIRMMAGGSPRHAEIQTNIIAALRDRLRGSGCKPLGSDMLFETHKMSARYPDVAVYCSQTGRDTDALRVFDNAKLVVEILSPSTRRHDETIKLGEYRASSSLDAIVYIDPDDESVRLLTRRPDQSWHDRVLDREEPVELPKLGVMLSRDDIFSRD